MKQSEFKKLRLFDKVSLKGSTLVVDDIDRNNQKILFNRNWVDMRNVDITKSKDKNKERLSKST